MEYLMLVIDIPLHQLLGLPAQSMHLPERIRFLVRVHLSRAILRTPTEPQEASGNQGQGVGIPLRRADIAPSACRFHVRSQGAGGLEVAEAARAPVLDSAVGL